VEKSGSWYAFNGERIGQGRDNAREILKENPEKLAQIDQELRKTLGLLSTSSVSDTVGVAEIAAAGGGRK